MSITTFTKKHPVLTYYFLTFVISWGGGLVALGPAGFLGIRQPSQAQFVFAILAGIAGPSASGILLTRAVDGRAGLQNPTLPIAQMESGRPLVRGGSPDRPAGCVGRTVRAVTDRLRVCPQYSYLTIRRPSS